MDWSSFLRLSQRQHMSNAKGSLSASSEVYILFHLDYFDGFFGEELEPQLP